MDQGQEVRHLVLLRPRVYRVHLRLAEGPCDEKVTVQYFIHQVQIALGTRQGPGAVWF